MTKKLVNSVKKALDVLDIMIFDDLDRKGLPLAELSRRTGIPTNTLHGLVSTLSACGYVRQNPNSSYLAGKKIDDVGRQNLIRFKLSDKIPALLDEYREKTGESVVFYVLINSEKVPAHAVNRKGLFNIDFKGLRKAPFFSTATSRVIYAFAEEEEQKNIIERWGMPGENWEKTGSLKELEKASLTIRKKGYAETISHNRSIYNIAFPVIDSREKLFGAVGTYTPLSESTPERKEFLKKQMKNLASRLRQLID